MRWWEKKLCGALCSWCSLLLLLRRLLRRRLLLLVCDADVIRHVSTSPLRPHCAVTCSASHVRGGQEKGNSRRSRSAVGAQSGRRKATRPL